MSTQGSTERQRSSAPGHWPGDVLSIEGRHGGGHGFSQHLGLVVGQVKYGRGFTCVSARGQGIGEERSYGLGLGAVALAGGWVQRLRQEERGH